jgi:hypothetical protein
VRPSYWSRIFFLKFIMIYNRAPGNLFSGGMNCSPHCV